MLLCALSSLLNTLPSPSHTHCPPVPPSADVGDDWMDGGAVNQGVLLECPRVRVQAPSLHHTCYGGILTGALQVRVDDNSPELQQKLDEEYWSMTLNYARSSSMSAMRPTLLACQSRAEHESDFPHRQTETTGKRSGSRMHRCRGGSNSSLYAAPSIRTAKPQTTQHSVSVCN